MSYSLSKISSDSKLVKMLIEMDGYICDGKLEPNQLPIEDLSALVVEEIFNKECPERKKYIVLGALESVIEELKNESMDAVSFDKHIRQIIAYLL